jgi:anti-sigma regulatory factor (Ser/Thr protein kinase)
VAASIELELPRGPEAPSLARAATREFCDKLEVSDGSCQTIVLLVSETVTNAVKHSTAPNDAGIQFRLQERPGGAVKVEVNDGGSGFEPAPREQSQADRGWGLYLVAKESLRWGVESDSGTLVWFEVAASARRSD